MKSVIFLLACHAQCIGQETLSSTSRPDGIDFPTGYEFRIASSEGSARHQFVLRYPDGKDEVIWSAPSRQYMNDKYVPTGFGAVTYGKIADQTLSLVVSGPIDSWWWIRWDMKNKRRFPAIEFPLARLWMNRWELLDGKSLKVFTERTNTTLTLTVDDKGVLFTEGKPWRAEGYYVFGENWSKLYLDLGIGGEIVYNDTPTGFPFDDDRHSKGFEYTMDADGTRQPRRGLSWQMNLPDPSDAMRIGPPFRDEKGASSPRGSSVTASISTVSKANESEPFRDNRVVWAWVGIGTISIAVVVYLFLRSTGSKSNEGKRPKID